MKYSIRQGGLIVYNSNNHIIIIINIIIIIIIIYSLILCKYQSENVQMCITIIYNNTSSTKYIDHSFITCSTVCPTVPNTSERKAK